METPNLDASTEAVPVLLEPEEMRVLKEAVDGRLAWRVPLRLSMIDQLLLGEARKKLENH